MKKKVIIGASALLLLVLLLAIYSATSYRSDECQIAHRSCQYNCHLTAENINDARSCSLDCFALYASCEQNRQGDWKSFNFKPTW